MVNILDLLKGQLTEAAIGKVAGMIGENQSTTSSAISAILPALLGGLVNKGGTRDGAASVLDFLNDNKNDLDDGIFDDIVGFLGDGSKTSAMMNIGSAVLPFILGGKKAGFMNLIGKATGLNSKAGSGLTSLLAPMLMSMIGKQVKKSGLDAGGLMNMLLGQKEHVAKAAPAEFSNLLGFSGKTTESVVREESTGGGGFMKWLFPLLLVGGLGWFFMNNGCGADVNTAADNVVETTEETVTDAVKNAVTYTVDETGNLVDDAGNIIKKAGEFTKDAAGNIVDGTGNAIQSIETKTSEVVSDATGEVRSKVTDVESIVLKLDDSGNLINESGTIVYKAGEFSEVNGYFVDKNGNRLGRVWDKIKDAVVKAADKTADFFKGTFGKMFSKESGAEKTYLLTDMAFDTESHKIKSFSKMELEGLVSALKASPDTKVEVQVHTGDGKNEKESKKWSEMRAEQIKNMLNALGANGKQIKFKGMGADDAAKAGKNAIELVVQ